MIHEYSIGTTRIEIAEQRFATWGERVVHPVQKLNDQFILEVVDQPDRVDQVLRRKRRSAASHGQQDQVFLQQMNVLLDAALFRLAIHGRQCLKVEIQAVNRHALRIFNSLEQVEHLAGGSTREAGNVDFLFGRL